MHRKTTKQGTRRSSDRANKIRVLRRIERKETNQLQRLIHSYRGRVTI